MSPTARSLDLLRKQGFIVQVVERFCPYSKRRIDLYGIIDILAINYGKIYGVQATSRSNHSARVKKALASVNLGVWLGAEGIFQVHSWAKSKKSRKWEVRISEAKLGVPRDGEPIVEFQER